MTRFNLRHLAAGFVGAGVLLLFQNCDKVGHSVQFNDATVRLASVSVPPQLNSNDNPPTTGSTGEPTTQGSSAGTCSHGNGNSHNGDSEQNGDSNNTNLVECDLGGPSNKVASDGSANLVVISGNSSDTRICMSENACLKLINVYAAARNCTLAPGAATTPTLSQCTQIFPGSNGTCHNAQIVDDATIEAMLAQLAKD